jgi:long-chain fatty acid transport protein
MYSPLRPALALTVGLLLPASAEASAYYFADAGTRAIGRGGAFVAGANDLSAQYYNPAALIRLRQTQAMFNISGVDQYVYFQRAADDGTSEPFEASQNEGRFMVIPAFGVASRFGLERTTFAFGLYTPFAPDMRYPAEGAQRYTQIDSLIWQFTVGPSMAHRFTDWLCVGAGIGWTVIRVEQELALTTDSTGLNSDDPQFDVNVALKAWDRFIFNWNAGLLIQPHDQWSIGLSVNPPMHIEARGSLTTDFTGNILATNFDGTRFSDDDIRMLMNLPLILRGGVQFEPTTRSRVELAGVWEGWSVFEEALVTDLDLNIRHNPDSMLLQEDAVVTNDIHLVANYEDSWSVRLGGEYDFGEHLTWRLGGFYEKTGVPLATQGVGLVDGNKWALATGGTWSTRKVNFDLSLARSFIARRDIVDSQVAQLILKVDPFDPTASEVINGKIVGNGFFESYLTFVSAGLTMKFGRGTRQDEDPARTGRRS